MKKNIFAKKLADDDDQKLPIDPIQLYQTVPYKDGFAYLRGIQEEVLGAWHKIRDRKDVLIKMNTGSGKTLTSLLMLYSKLVEKHLPCVYICPDNQLVDQTIAMANDYGIPICAFEKNRQGEFPSDFLNAKKILVCNFFKLFNGYSIFNRDQVKIGALVIDDAHKCLDIARKQTSLQLSSDHPIAKKLFKLFENSLKHQLIGTFQRLSQGDPTLTMKVPYWTWFENQEKILKIINDYITSDMDDEEKLNFPFQFMTDHLLEYNCYLSGSRMEISPIHTPYQYVASFHEADHRYILSATFEDDYDLIRDLGISRESILNPIVPKDRKDVGKRLILAPGRFDATLTDQAIIDFIAKYPKRKLNVVVLVPSTTKAEPWEKAGAIVVNKENIEPELERLRTSKNNFLVFVNRYDGIDLQGDMCRILVIDGLPKYKLLEEQYAESRLDEMISGTRAQIIEQGLGRAVRSGADFCVAYLMGADLLKFVAIGKNLNYFTPVTREQLNLGLQLLDDETPGKTSLKTIGEIADLCISEDTDWIRYHAKALSGVSAELISAQRKFKINLAEYERLALAEFRKRQYEKAGDIIQKEILDKDGLTPKESAWYYQFAGQMTYIGNPPKSNALQSKAWQYSTNMFHPEHDHLYKKILQKGAAQASIMKKFLAQFTTPMDIKIYVNDLVKDLKYGEDFDSKTFEIKLNELGEFLGFESQMPEDTTGEGPDVLWCLGDGSYLIHEAKSQKESGDISKADIEQIQQSEIWFKKKYGATAKYIAVTLQKSNKKEKKAQIEKQHQVIDAEHLELLETNLRKFADALQSSSPAAHSEEDIAKLLVAFKLTPALFKETYIKPIK